MSVTETYFVYCSAVLLCALLLDRGIGEVRRYHPLVGFGYCANRLERWLNAPSVNGRAWRVYGKGVLAWALLVLPLPVALYCAYREWGAQWPVFLRLGLDVIIVYFALGLQSLKQHGLQVYRPLQKGDLVAARHFTGYLVSRDTAALTPDSMSRATVESMLENGHDAVIATLFWFVVGGAPAVVLHRLANTLDAMWGYKTPRYDYFGWAAARCDDALGFISAKVCALLYASQRHFWRAMINAFRQSQRYKSHNGGWVMAAGATTLNIKLGGRSLYQGKAVLSPVLGQGDEVTVADIPRSLQRVDRASAVFVIVIFCMGVSVLAYSRIVGAA